MKVLYIDHYAGSPTLGMEFRPHLMAQEWARSGVETTLLAGSYSHLRKVNPTVTRTGEEQVIDGVPFRFIKTREYEGNGAQRVVSMVEFVGKGLRDASSIAKVTRPDAVIASSTYPFDTYLAERIAKIAGARLVHEIHDLWPLTPQELGGYSDKHPFIATMAAAEKSAYRNSDVIVSILPNAEEHVRSLGITTPVVNVPNGVQLDREPGPADEAVVALVTRLQAQGNDVISYAGGLSVSNAMDDLVEAMALLKDEPVAAVVIGDGVDRGALEARAAELGLDKVFFVGSIPKAAVHNTLSAMDGLYIGSEKSRLYRYGFSANKIFDYMLTGLPIVDALDSEHTPLAYAGCSVRAAAKQPADIARAIREVVALDPTQRGRIRATETAYVREHHAYDKLAADFLAALKG
ncbi:glycosyltransferase family 4 protein [Propionibacteriaceae bacterium G57]|uniref:glycosyltransferase family 4 protein n=1 Tax=Aestuariimicrobium sp. G57 TaxID=3418485 RepID=UPI003DA794D8